MHALAKKYERVSPPPPPGGIPCQLCAQVIHDPEQKLLIMVMEFMPGGLILSSSRAPGLATEPLGEPAARTYFRWVPQQLLCLPGTLKGCAGLVMRRAAPCKKQHMLTAESRRHCHINMQ